MCLHKLQQVYISLLLYCEFFPPSLLFHLETLKTIISPSHPLSIASCITSSYLEQLQKSTLALYVWEEDSVKIDVFHGNQEQSEDQQDLLSRSTGTGYSRNVSLGFDI